MDKYTVDLDQVLNDFEYSEFTDNAREEATNLLPIPNSIQSTISKHSITTVFNSLNEYLNSDITPKPETVLQNKSNLHFTEQDDNNVPTAVDTCNGTNGNLEENEIEAKAVTDTVRELSLIETDKEESINAKTEEVSLVPQLEIEEKPLEIEKEYETNPSETEILPNSNLEENNNSNQTEIEETDVIEIPVQLNNSNQNEEICTRNDSQSVLENVIINNLTESEPSEEIIETEPEETEKSNLSKAENQENLEKEKEKSNLSKTEPEESVEEEEKGVVSFQLEDEVNLDDNEINKLLEGLEDECPVLETKESADSNLETETTENPVTEDDDSLSRPNDLALPERKINLIGDPGSTPYNNIYVNKELPKEETESVSPTFSDVSSTASTVSTASTEPVQDEERFYDCETSPVTEPVSSQTRDDWLGKQAPLWIPDSDTLSCLHCDLKFNLLKRRHHCRACGLVLCSKCCNLRFRLEYLDAEARVCNKCFEKLSGAEAETPSAPRPNPNNPSEYCSTIPPLQQVAGTSSSSVPAVMVPVGVLKRKGSNKKSNKSVMFCDGIRPGSDLTNLDNDFNFNNGKLLKKNVKQAEKASKNLPLVDGVTNSFIPSAENCLPPTVSVFKADVSYSECGNNRNVVEMLENEALVFALNINLRVHLKIVTLDCCVNKHVWCFSTEGLINVGQDELVFLIECLEEEEMVPKDIFLHVLNIYNDALKGNSVKEMGLTLHNTSNFMGSKNHAGFIFIRPSFQCVQNLILPSEPFLVGVLIHKWETPWAKLFPLRLVLRLGALCRYYPCPLVSTRFRDSTFVEIGHTIINLLADFRNFSYGLAQIRGLVIHMEDKCTTIRIPSNRYDQVMSSINNSSDHILAFAGNFSMEADSHLVCIQDTQDNDNCYSTHAINIHNKPRKVTGASFIVFNGALKSNSGLTAKSNIVEDGLMIQVLPEHMVQIRESLRTMKDYKIHCGCVNAESDEVVNIVWGENDVGFNQGVVSCIDGMALTGIPSIRVHNGKDFVCNSGTRLLRWTEVFIIENTDEAVKNQDPVDVSKVAESIAKATCSALVKYLDLLVSNNFYKIGIRTNLHLDNVSYMAGSNSMKLPPIYMKSLDNELIPVLHRISSNNVGDNSIVLELLFRILNV